MNLLFLKVFTEKHKDEEFNQLIWVHVVYSLHIMLLSMEKKLQIGNSKTDVISEQNIP